MRWRCTVCSYHDIEIELVWGEIGVKSVRDDKERKRETGRERESRKKMCVQICAKKCITNVLDRQLGSV